jgi:2'-deoxynucleoside 5'-phosphate N-hydrolase
MRLKIYFCGSIAGGRRLAATYREIVQHLEALGHRVLTRHVAFDDALDWEEQLGPREVFARDMAWLAESNALVAEVTVPSLGVGYEIAEGLSLRRPVLCLYSEGADVSRLITGNTRPGLVVHSYPAEAQMLAVIDAFMADVGAGGGK